MYMHLGCVSAEGVLYARVRINLVALILDSKSFLTSCLSPVQIVGDFTLDRW